VNGGLGRKVQDPIREEEEPKEMSFQPERRGEPGGRKGGGRSRRRGGGRGRQELE